MDKLRTTTTEVYIEVKSRYILLPLRIYRADVPSVEDGKALAEAILAYEGKEHQWGWSADMEGTGIAYDTIASDPPDPSALVYVASTGCVIVALMVWNPDMNRGPYHVEKHICQPELMSPESRSTFPHLSPVVVCS